MSQKDFLVLKCYHGQLFMSVIADFFFKTYKDKIIIPSFIIPKPLDKNLSRSSRQRCSIKKGVLKNLAKFT